MCKHIVFYEGITFLNKNSNIMIYIFDFFLKQTENSCNRR